jgi:hypothetical protein
MRQGKHHEWIDLALWIDARGWEVDDVSPDFRLDSRLLDRALGSGEAAADGMQQLSDYSGVLGAWAQVTDLSPWMPDDLVKALRGLSRPLKGDRLTHAKVLIDAYALNHDAHLGARVEAGHLRLTIGPESELHRLTTAGWLQFTAAPYKVLVCDWCKRSFTAMRSTARYCGGACRQAAHRAGTEA